MKRLIPILLLLAVGFSPVPAWSYDYAHRADAYSFACAGYVRGYQNQLTTDAGYIHASFGQYAGFIKGYLNAYNKGVGNGLRDILGNISIDSLHLFIDGYCRENPLYSVHDGLDSFFKTQCKLRSPNPSGCPWFF